MNRKPLINLSTAQKLYGKEKTTFPRPRFVPEGYCEWCGKKIENKRRKSCCSPECSKKFAIATSPVMYANEGSAGGYRNHIMRRDMYTCTDCGELHVKYSEYDIPLPSTDGHLEIHHIEAVCDGGSDAPENLSTKCDVCHDKITREQQRIRNERKRNEQKV